MGVFQLCGASLQLFTEAAKQIIQSLNIAEDVRAEGSCVTEIAFERDAELPGEAVKGKLHIKAAIPAD